MEVIMKDDKKIPFYLLHCGDVFMYNNLLFMRIETVLQKNDKVINAVRLDGKTTDFNNEDVIHIKGKFIVD